MSNNQPDDFLPSIKRLCVAARTTGGTAGRDAGLCAALDRVEAMLSAIDDPDWQAQANQNRAAQPDDLQAENDRAVGRAWRENSSLEEWFPLTFEELCRLRVEVSKLRAERERILDRKFLVAVKDLCNNYGGPTPDDCTGDYAWVGDVWRTAARILKSADQP